jgi:hypothetical protein
MLLNDTTSTADVLFRINCGQMVIMYDEPVRTGQDRTHFWSNICLKELIKTMVYLSYKCYIPILDTGTTKTQSRHADTGHNLQ